MLRVKVSLQRGRHGVESGSPHTRHRAHVARLYPTPAQVQKLDRQGHTARALWNLLHEWHGWGGRGGSVAKRPSPQEMDRQLRDARSRPLPGWEWLAQLPAQASQQVLRQYLGAWDRYFKELSGPPRFKHRTARMAVDIPQAADLRVVRVNRRWGEVTVLLVGRVKFRWTRPIPVTTEACQGRITGARSAQGGPEAPSAESWRPPVASGARGVPPGRLATGSSDPSPHGLAPQDHDPGRFELRHGGGRGPEHCWDDSVSAWYCRQSGQEREGQGRIEPCRHRNGVGPSSVDARVQGCIPGWSADQDRRAVLLPDLRRMRACIGGEPEEPRPIPLPGLWICGSGGHERGEGIVGSWTCRP